MLLRLRCPQSVPIHSASVDNEPRGPDTIRAIGQRLAPCQYALIEYNNVQLIIGTGRATNNRNGRRVRSIAITWMTTYTVNGNPHPATRNVSQSRMLREGSILSAAKVVSDALPTNSEAVHMAAPPSSI